MKVYYERKEKIKRNKVILVSIIGAVSLLSILYFFNSTTDYAYNFEKPIGYNYEIAFKNLTLPENIVIDTLGNVYVADSDNHRIQKFTSNGTFLLEWGNKGSGPGEFSYPRGISMDSSGNVYVADSGNHRIQKFTSNGIFIESIGEFGQDQRKFDFPNDIIIDSVGNFYITDTGNKRIQKIENTDTDSVKIWTESFFDSPKSIAIDSSNNIYVTDNNNHKIYRFDSSGIYKESIGSFGNDGENLYFPSKITIDLDDNIYVADSGNNKIKIIDIDKTSVNGIMNTIRTISNYLR